MNVNRFHFFFLISAIAITSTFSQSYNWYSSTEDALWGQSSLKLSKTAANTPVLEVTEKESIVTFQSWGMTFNELGWDALNMLPRDQQEIILRQLFDPQGDLRFSIGRFAMNANDYARNWYSCSDVAGDFQLKYFNINRDKTTLIPYIKAAQRYQPDLTCWVSPWSPPAWMKINHHYAVLSNREYNDLSYLTDHALFEGADQKDNRVFPRQLTVNDYFIQDPRYLTTYANLFCKFIDAYGEQNIPVSRVMFQNEAWSYTAYPGCAWTADGIIRFNVEYLAPALKEQHPGVSLYLGTINTNRFDEIDKILADPRMPNSIQGVGFQWEGGQILPAIRAKYPQYKYVQTEGECGWGSFDWNAGEHTFGLINHYLGNGCEEYTIWNVILYDEGKTPWGWKQNALIRVDSQKGTATYTPEYYAVKHYANFIAKGSKIITQKDGKDDKIKILVAQSTEGKYTIVAGNFNDEDKDITVKIGERYLNATLQPHSLNTFQMK